MKLPSFKPIPGFENHYITKEGVVWDSDLEVFVKTSNLEYVTLTIVGVSVHFWNGVQGKKIAFTHIKQD